MQWCYFDRGNKTDYDTFRTVCISTKDPQERRFQMSAIICNESANSAVLSEDKNDDSTANRCNVDDEEEEYDTVEKWQCRRNKIEQKEKKRWGFGDADGVSSDSTTTRCTDQRRQYHYGVTTATSSESEDEHAYSTHSREWRGQDYPSTEHRSRRLRYRRNTGNGKSGGVGSSIRPSHRFPPTRPKQ